jgi:hypothetical protein
MNDHLKRFSLFACVLRRFGVWSLAPAVGQVVAQRPVGRLRVPGWTPVFQEASMPACLRRADDSAAEATDCTIDG